MSYKVPSFVLVLASAAAGIAAYAATPAETQKVRHEHYEELGDAFKSVRDQSKADSPDWAALQKAADIVQKASKDQIQWFPKGSGPEAGKTRALPEIWTKPAEFEAAMKMFEDRAPALGAAVKAKDVAAVDKAFKALGGSCKNCHDNFRGPE
jgi:cytochrome c556